MVGFPDESQMERSQDNSEPIRGGSIGFNRILGLFVEASNKDIRPMFNAVLISAFTILRNVWTMKEASTLEDLEKGFVKDINLFLEYYDTYLSFVLNRTSGERFCPVIVYFPSYDHIPKNLVRDSSGKTKEFFDLYKKFLARHGNTEGEVRKLENVRCFWIRAGDVTYPHKEVARKFREIVSHPKSLYSSGDSLGLITHIPLDYHLAFRVRGVIVLESYTAKLRKPDEFKFKLDKEGRVPFQSVTHAVLGDSALLKPQISPKIRKSLLETAEKDRWISRSEEDLQSRISKITNISTSILRSYAFN